MKARNGLLYVCRETLAFIVGWYILVHSKVSNVDSINLICYAV